MLRVAYDGTGAASVSGDGGTVIEVKSGIFSDRRKLASKGDRALPESERIRQRVWQYMQW